jgi:hypothetical protein
LLLESGTGHGFTCLQPCCEPRATAHVVET